MEVHILFANHTDTLVEYQDYSERFQSTSPSHPMPNLVPSSVLLENYCDQSTSGLATVQPHGNQWTTPWPGV